MSDMPLNEKIARRLCGVAHRKPDDICYYRLIPEDYGQPFWKTFLREADTIIAMAKPNTTLPDLKYFDRADDEAIDWVTKNLMSIRRDNGNMDYSFKGVIRAYQAGKASAPTQATVDLLSQVITETAGELGCENDNEAILQAIHDLKQVPPDVASLVNAARMVTGEDWSINAMGELDKALTPFATRVPWADEHHQKVD